MKTLLFTTSALALGFLLGIALNWATIRYLRRRVKELRSAVEKGREPPQPETMKRVIWVCLSMGIAWVWCSYILAALDKPQIAESLSQVALAEIIVPVAVYAGKSAVENLSKNNHWPDKPEAHQETPDDEGEMG